MRAFAALRSTHAVWFVPLLFALGTYLPVSNAIIASGYVASDLAGAGLGLRYNGPLLAGFAAFWFRGRGRFHRTVRSPRSGAADLIASGWPLLVGGPVASCIAIMVVAGAVPNDPVSWQVIAVIYLALTACTLLGVVFSWALPVVISVPASVALTFYWINFLPSSSSPLQHNMTPLLDNFAQTTRPSTAGVTAVVVMTAAVCLGAVACVGRHKWERTPQFVAIPLALLVPVAGTCVGALTLLDERDSLNLMAVEKRTTPLTCTQPQGINVCLWPDGMSRAGELADIAVETNATLTTWGLAPIREIGQGGLRAGAIDVDTSSFLSNEMLRYSMAEGYLARQLGCPADFDPEADQRIAALVAAGGVGVGDLAGIFGEETVSVVSGLLDEGATAPGAVGRWYTDGLAGIRCLPSR